MRYWLVLVVYILFVMSYINYAQGCSTTEKGMTTGAACSIKDLPKIETEEIKIEEKEKKATKTLEKEKTTDKKDTK